MAFPRREGIRVSRRKPLPEDIGAKSHTRNGSVANLMRFRRFSPRQKRQWLRTKVAWAEFREVAGIAPKRSFMDAVRRAGITRETGLAWINGLTEPKVSVAYDFARANGITLDKFHAAWRAVWERAQQRWQLEEAMRVAQGEAPTPIPEPKRIGRPPWEYESADPENEPIDQLLILLDKRSPDA